MPNQPERCSVQNRTRVSATKNVMVRPVEPHGFPARRTFRADEGLGLVEPPAPLHDQQPGDTPATFRGGHPRVLGDTSSAATTTTPRRETHRGPSSSGGASTVGARRGSSARGSGGPRRCFADARPRPRPRRWRSRPASGRWAGGRCRSPGRRLVSAHNSVNASHPAPAGSVSTFVALIQVMSSVPSAAVQTHAVNVPNPRAIITNQHATNNPPPNALTSCNALGTSSGNAWCASQPAAM